MSIYAHRSAQPNRERREAKPSQAKHRRRRRKRRRGRGSMERVARVEELTSGASGRIIPVFRNMRRSVPSPASLLRVVLLLHSLAMWFLFLILRRSPISSRTVAASSTRRKTVRGRWSMAAEEEDVRRRREIAEKVEMVSPSEEMMWRGETSVFEGTRRRALFCRSWMPMSGDLR